MGSNNQPGVPAGFLDPGHNAPLSDFKKIPRQDIGNSERLKGRNIQRQNDAAFKNPLKGGLNMSRTSHLLGIWVLTVFFLPAAFVIRPASAEELIYKIVPDTADYSKENKGQYYIRFISRYAHFRDDTGNGGFWAALKDLFKGEKHPKVLVIASADYGSSRSTSKAGRVLLSLDPSDKQYDDSTADYNKPLLPHMRLSHQTELKLVIEFKKSTIRDPSILANIINAANSVPFLDEAAQGKISLAADILNAICSAIPEDQGHRLRADIGLGELDALFGVKRIVVYPSSEHAAIENLRGNFPSSKGEVAASQWDTLPSMIIIDVEKRKQVIEDATTIFLDTNPISEPLKKHANAMQKMNNVERLQYCRSVLRPFVEDILGFNVVDSAIAVVMTMDRGGFDPDKTGAYLRHPGCYDFNDLELARAYNGRPGSCSSTDCRTVVNFIQHWAANINLSPMLQETVSVIDNLGDTRKVQTLTPRQFSDQYISAATYRDYNGTSIGGEIEVDLYDDKGKEVTTRMKVIFENVRQCRRSDKVEFASCRIRRLIFDRK
jgi:hypothetical protein